MIIGLDWDGCSSNDPVGFMSFARMMRSRGHKVYIVTMRYPSELGEIRDYASFVDGIYPTSRQAKRPHMLSQGIMVDVWIDDNPEAVHMSADKIWGCASPEGSVIDPQHSSNKSNVTASDLETVFETSTAMN